MSPLKVLLVDDEPPARARLRRMLEALDDVAVVGEAGDGEEALTFLSHTTADALLLDVQMPRLDGLALAARWADLPPIVFVTAHSEHAVKAFEVRAVDYLLKPVREERLKSRRPAPQPVAADVLSQGLGASPTRIVTTERGLVRLFDAEKITRFWSSDKYTVFKADGAEHLSEEPLNELEQRLRAHRFMRVHRAELVNLGAVTSLRTEDGLVELVLSDGQLARVSRRSVAEVKTALGL